MVVGEIAEGVDLLVVGGGPGGYTTALRAAQLGRSVTLVDRHGEAGIGGVCLQVGCIPSKALIELANGVGSLDHLRRAGLQATQTGIDLEVFQDWKSSIITKLNAGVRRLLRGAGVQIVAGGFTLTRPAQAVVETPEGQARFFEFTDLVLATGSRPVIVPDLPYDHQHVIDSSDVLELTSIPESVAVVGGGYIGVELGTALAKLGARVTIVEALDRLLPSVGPDVARIVQQRAAELGITVHTRTTATDFADGKLRLVTHDGELVVAADKVVVAAGRRANTDDLGLERADIHADATGLLAVAADRRISPHIAAIGDITPGRALAHKASAEATVAAEALTGRRVAFDPAAVPAIVFGDPEVATAGLAADQATEQGLDISVATVPLTASGRALTMGETAGMIQLVAERESGVVVGVHIVGPHASELIAAAVVAIEMGCTAEDLALTVYPHPTLSEQMSDVADRWMREVHAVSNAIAPGGGTEGALS